MRLFRRIVLTLVMLSLLPWVTYPAAAGGGRAAAMQAAAAQPATVPQAMAPLSKAGLRDGFCRTALPVGACHLDWLPPGVRKASGGTLAHRLPGPDRGSLPTGRGVLPIDRPPISF